MCILDRAPSKSSDSFSQDLKREKRENKYVLWDVTPWVKDSCKR